METQTYVEQELCHEIIGAAIEVHKYLGAGLLELIYEACLADEFTSKGLSYDRQRHCHIHYRGKKLKEGFKMDFVVEGKVIVELKSVERLLQVHESQLLTYMRLSEKELGLLINFNVPLLKDGIRRKIMSKNTQNDNREFKGY